MQRLILAVLLFIICTVAVQGDFSTTGTSHTFTGTVIISGGELIHVGPQAIRGKTLYIQNGGGAELKCIDANVDPQNGNIQHIISAGPWAASLQRVDNTTGKVDGVYTDTGNGRGLVLRGDNGLDSESDLKFTASKGPIIQSPNGTHYRIVVSDTGAVSAVAVP